MTLDEALLQACSSVAVTPPKALAMRKWLRTDALGKNGRGDGSVIYDEDRVTAWNWQTGEKATVWLKTERTVEDRREAARRRARDRREDRERSARAAAIAGKLIAAARPEPHPYLARKGFLDEKPLTLDAAAVRRIGGDYLVPAGANAAIVLPARLGQRAASVQLIWADGTKKFLYGGEMSGASHRIASGADTWLCEGYATALSLRASLKGLGRQDTVLVCFSASNIAKVAPTIRGRCLIAADNDAPPKANPNQFGGLGAGEFFARKAGKPYLMPPEQGQDINDLHASAGIFAVQRLISDLLREARV